MTLHHHDHPYSHGLLQAELHVPATLPPELAQGMFAAPGVFPVLMRLSGGRGTRAMALRVLGLSRAPLHDGARSPTLSQDFVLGGEAAPALLGETYFSQARILYGAAIAQVCVAPIAPDAGGAGCRQPPGAPDGAALRAAMVEHFAERGAEWEVRVAIEGGAFGWQEDAGRYRSVARLVARPQPAWSSALARAVDSLSFSPWHCVAAHQPIGALLRGRRDGYGAAAHFRAEQAGVNMAEPYNLSLTPS